MRARSRILALLAAAATLALVAFLLLHGGGAPVPFPVAVETTPRAGAGEDGEAAVPPRTPAAALAGSPAAPVPGGPCLELRAVVGGEWGLPGVQVLAVERFRDGSLVAMIGDDAPDGGETDGDGRITLRYKTEPVERLIGVLPDDAEFESADGAGAAGEIGPFRVFRASGTGPVTLRFRDPEGRVLVRPVDAKSGESLAGREGIRFEWTEQEPGEERQEENAPARGPGGGWFRCSVPDGAREFRLLVPGYLPAPAPEGGWKGRLILRMEADPAAVRGRLAGLEDLRHESFLQSAEDGRPCEAASLGGLPARSGPFALSGVPRGRWDLVVRALHGDLSPDHAAWATARFDYRGEGLDLGALCWSKGGVLRARLLGEDGKPDAEAPLHLVAAPSGQTPILAYGLSPRRTDQIPEVQVTWPGQDSGRDARQAVPGQDGWVEFGGLRPGGTYVLATGRVPGLTRTVTVPREPGEPLVAELDGGRATTTCSLRFTVQGEEPRFWRYISGPAYSDFFSTGKGTLDAEIPPGRYIFAGMTTVEEVGAISRFYGEVEIPDSGKFEAIVDLKPAVK